MNVTCRECGGVSVPWGRNWECLLCGHVTFNCFVPDPEPPHEKAALEMEKDFERDNLHIGEMRKI